MKKTKILIVEDDAATAHAIRDALIKSKYAVAGIEKSGETAQQTAENLKPDLILMDIVLSGKKGGIKASKIITEKLNIPIISITAAAHIDTVIRACKTHPCYYILKPIKAYQLFSTIDAALHHFKLEQQLKESESRLAKAQEIAHLGNWHWDIKSGKITWSAEMFRIFGIRPDKFEGTADAVLRRIHPDDRWMQENAFAIASKGHKVIPFEFRIVHSDGSERIIEITNESSYDDSGRLCAMFGIAHDITDRKLAVEEIQRINRLYNVLSKINLTLVQMHTHQNLFHEVCRIAVEFGGFKLAWIGWHDKHSRAVIPIASAGESQLYMKNLSIYSDDRPEGRGATGTAIREKRTYLCNDIQADPHMLPWHEVSKKAGIRSSAAFPFYLKDEVYGALNLYAAEKNFFNDKEVELLEEVALNLSFGLNNLEEEAERLRAEEALRESEEQYRLLIQNVSDVVFSIDPGFTLLSVTPSVEKTLGYKPEELIGRNIWEPNVLAPESKQTAITAINQVFTSKTAGLFELVFISKDGSRKIGEVNTSPLIRDGKVVAIISVARDITERKQAEDFVKNSLHEKEILLREIHHRVKNNMQLVISLLNLQAKNIPDEKSKQLYMDLENRIKAMSLIHEKLYHSENLSRIDFSEYIRSISSQLSSIYFINPKLISLELHMDPVELSIDQAVPCGLIVNEILTNSFKHAFPSDFQGPRKVTITLRQGSHNTIELIISDNGIGARQNMNMQTKGSLGMLLIKILAKQIEATVKLEYATGTSITITFRNEIEEKNTTR